MTAKKANKPHRLSTLLQRRKKNQSEEKLRNCPQSWSDYNSAPLAVKTVGGALILPPATLTQADAPPEALAERSGQTDEKIGLPLPNTPGTPPATPGPGPAHGGPRSPQAGALAAGYASPAATGTANRGPRETPYAHASETETAHNAAGKPQDERKIKPGEITPGKRKCSTEPPRRRHAKRAGGRQQGSKTPQQGRTPTRAKRKPAGSVAPGGIELL